jgi:uncharacterized membrane protein YhaH (DUF805 family)
MQKDNLRSLFSLRGRVRRGAFWRQVFMLASAFTLAFLAIDAGAGRAATAWLYPPFFWLLLRLAVRRYHDLDRSGAWLLLLAIPLLGPLWVGIELFLRGGRLETNRFGVGSEAGIHDYHMVR